MKILFLTNKSPYPPKDGGSIATLSMIRSFALLGHETTVLAMNTRKHHVTPFEIPEIIKQATILHLVEVPAKITPGGALRNLLFSTKPYNAERFISKHYAQKLEVLLRSHRYDIVQLEGLYLTPYIPLIRKYSSAKIGFRAHNIENEIWKRTALNAPFFKKGYLNLLAHRIEKMELEVINTYDLLVPITLRDEKYFQKNGNTRPVLTVPAGVSAEDVFEGEPNCPETIFYIGALDWVPNQEGLLWFIEKCFPSIVKKAKNIRLLVAGRNAPRSFVEKLKHPNIDFLGEIDDARTFMRNNGIMIVPLLSGSGMRVKVIEGMANAKAIVATTIGCEGIDAVNGKHIFVSDCPKEYSAYVLKLVKNIKQRRSMAVAARDFVLEKYDNASLVKELSEFYKKIVS
jgi:polysaccharide biosynthesis protein PslH